MTARTVISKLVQLADVTAIATTGVLIAPNGVRALYVPDQSIYTNSIAIGSTGLQNLVHNSGADANANIAVGFGALAANTTGFSNIAVGTNALTTITTQTLCTAVGSGAAKLSTGTNITAIGANTLFAGGGDYNVAVGSNALNAATTATMNTACGTNSMFLLTTGYENAGFGQHALRNATTAFYNTSIGKDSLYNPNGNASNETIAGARNVAVGRQSGASDSSDPSDMVVLGHQAIGRNGSIAIGSSTQATADGAIAIGQGTVASQKGAVAIGRDSSGNPVSVNQLNQIALGTVNHHVLLKTVAAPADSVLAASQFTFWLDPTVGASVFHIKAKNSAGAVVNGTVNLS